LYAAKPDNPVKIRVQRSSRTFAALTKREKPFRPDLSHALRDEACKHLRWAEHHSSNEMQMATSRISQSVAPAMIRQPVKRTTRLRRALVIGDAVVGGLAWTLASAVPGSLLAEAIARPSWKHSSLTVVVLAAATLATLVVLAAERLHLSRVASMRTMEIARLARASLMIGAIALIGGRVLGEGKPVRFPILVAVLSFFLLNFWRMAFSAWLRKARGGGRFTRPIVLIGANDDALSLNRLMRTHPELGYRVVGIVGDDFRPNQYEYGGVPILGSLNALDRVLDTMEINGAFIAGGAFSQDTINKTVRTLLTHGVHIQLSTGIKGIDHRRMRTQSIAFEPMLYVERADLDRWQLAVKRVTDVTISSIVLTIMAPVMLGVAAMIRFHDGGPIFFRQERVGRDGETFTMFKFRSMVMDAESKLVDLRKKNVRQGPLFKLHSDPRVTPLGRIIRATSIDELPQLLNVLRGEMSLVGPRPALPSEVQHFDEDLLARQHVLPGITGLWQVNGRDNPDFAIYQRMDLFYVENWSVALDLSILLGTFKVVAGRAFSTFTKKRENVRPHLGSVVLE
jgi:exopolysaccharide biosynthesis polyprenyl glycosylphosphotransferase